MKKLVSGTSLIGGFLLLIVPRYILPVCEYEGYARMHCSDTALAEYVVGVLLMVIGSGTFFLKVWWQLIIGTALACLLFVVSYWLPDLFGYCQSPRMPCNYGMVPGVRFIALTGVMLTIIALVSFVRSARRKGIS
jgi:hypothetical protein